MASAEPAQEIWISCQSKEQAGLIRFLSDASELKQYV